MYEQTFTVNVDNGDDFEESDEQQRESSYKGIHKVQGVFPSPLTKTTMSYSKCSSWATVHFWNFLHFSFSGYCPEKMYEISKHVKNCWTNVTLMSSFDKKLVLSNYNKYTVLWKQSYFGPLIL